MDLTFVTQEPILASFPKQRKSENQMVSKQHPTTLSYIFNNIKSNNNMVKFPSSKKLTSRFWYVYLKHHFHSWESSLTYIHSLVGIHVLIHTVLVRILLGVSSSGSRRKPKRQKFFSVSHNIQAVMSVQGFYGALQWQEPGLLSYCTIRHGLQSQGHLLVEDGHSSSSLNATFSKHREGKKEVVRVTLADIPLARI